MCECVCFSLCVCVCSQRRIRWDHYLVPFTLFELALLYQQQGDLSKAAAHLEDAK